MICTHPEMHATTQTVRVAEAPGEPVKAFVLSVSLRCKMCGTPFYFLGVPDGMAYDGPRCAGEGQIALLPVLPQGEIYDAAHGLAPIVFNTAAAEPTE